MPRFTLRATMLVVAIVAVASFGVVMWRRSAYYHVKAENYDLQAIEAYFDSTAATSHGLPPIYKPTANEIAEARYFGLLFNHHKRLSEKYRYASRHPWLRVAPDPPGPAFVAPDPVATKPDSGIVRP